MRSAPDTPTPNSNSSRISCTAPPTPGSPPPPPSARANVPCLPHAPPFPGGVPRMRQRTWVHRPGGVTWGHACVGGTRAWSRPGDRVGVAWLGGTDGTCRYCRRGTDNLCPASVYTGWDRHGGYAEYLTAADAFVHPLPGGFSDAGLAPLLCAGIIGYRALRRAQVPPGGTLGMWGFGGSAHLAAQIAMGQGAEVHVFTRALAARELALSLGAASAQN